MKQAISIFLLLLLISMFSACTTGHHTENSLSTTSSSAITEHTETEPSQPMPTKQEQESEILTEESETVKIKITVNDTTLTAIPEENSSAKAFIELLREEPVTIQMSDYAGMEKVGPLGIDLPRNDTRISVEAGDIILYQGNQITIYYGTNTWSFTKLAVIENATEENLLDVLGYGDVSVTFSLA